MRPFLITSASILTLAAVCSTAWAQDCATDADCPEGFVCGGIQQSGERLDCEDPEDCPEPQPDPEPLGYCEPAPLTCTTDADCPSPLLCVERESQEDCTVAFGETTECEPITEVTVQCEYVPEDCSDDSDCAAGYECVTMPGGETCTATGVACAEGEECPAPEVECESEPDVHLCFPARVPCTSDADCSGDWSCFDFGLEVEPPPWWGEVDDPRACMPPGLVAVFEGRAEFGDVEGVSVAASDETGSGSSAQTPGRNTPGRSRDDGGCSVAPGSTEGKGITGLLLLGLALGLRRRPGCGSR